MHYGQTKIVTSQDAVELGKRAAQDVAAVIRRLLAERDQVRIIFAAGESQMTFLDALALEPDIEWQKVVCFNMDDFWEPRMDRQFSCGYQTQVQLYDKVHPKAFHLVDFKAADPHREADRFSDLIRQAETIDILCQGIGTSGHLAMNEPGITHFDDPQLVRVVDLVEQSKRQLIEDPNFKRLGYIPDKGITMTIPAMLQARHVFTMVPLALKRDILKKVFSAQAPDEQLPATVIHSVHGCLYVDRDSCPGNVQALAGITT